MPNVIFPVAQFMPMFDPLGSVIGCMILIYLAATYVAGFGAIAASFRAPQFGRAVGAAVFASALLLFLWFARGTIRSYRAPDSSLLVAAAAPALLGLIAWLIGARRAGRLELWSAPLGRTGYSNPMTYQTSAGKQFVVLATGSGANATLMAFALPE